MSTTISNNPGVVLRLLILDLSRLSSAMILSIINSVCKFANNCHNFSIHWYSLCFGSTKRTLSLFLIHSLVWYVLFHWIVGQMIMIDSKCLLYSFSIKSKTWWVFPQPVGPVNIVVCGSLYSLSFFFIQCLVLKNYPKREVPSF